MVMNENGNGNVENTKFSKIGKLNNLQKFDI